MEEAENPDDSPIAKIDESSTSPAKSCALCGCSTPAVRCDRCSSQIFCLSCDDMYHRHPKRRLHLRKAVDSIWNSSKSPRLRRRTELPGDPSKIPIPPPRSKKRERHTIGGGRLFLKQNHELGSFGHSKMFDLRTIAPPSKDVFAGQKTSPNTEGTYENETNMAKTVVENIATGNEIYENENIPMNTGGNVDNSNSMGQAPWNMPRTNISSPIQVSIPSSSPDMITNGQSFGYPMKPQSRSIADLTGAPPNPIGTPPYHLPHYPYMHPPMHPYSHSMAHLNCAQCMSSSWSNLMSPHPSPYFHPMPWGSANASLARGHPVPGANGHVKHGSVPSFPDPNFHFPYPGGAFYANGAPVVDPNFANLHQPAVEPQRVKRSPSGSRQTLSPENPVNLEVATDSAPEVKMDENPAPKDVNRRKQEIDDEPPTIPEPPSQPWSCLHCTYVNPPGIHVCEICCKTSYGNKTQSENQNEGRSLDSRNSDSPMELVNLDALSQSPDFIKQRVQKDEDSIGADSLETEDIPDTIDQEPQTPEPSVMLTTETQTSTTTKSTDVQTQNLIFQSIASSTDSIFPKQEISVQTETQTTAKNCSVATDPMISSQSMESLMSGFSAPPYQNRRAGWGRGASFSTQSLYERGRSRSPIPRSLSEAQSFVRDSSLPPEEAMHSWSQAWLMSDPMYYKPHNLPGYGQTGKEDYYDGTWGSMDKLNRRVKNKQGTKSETNPRPKFHRSLDDLKAEKTQDVIHSRELQFLQTVKEAERCGFSLEDLHVAYLHCGRENPVFWLEDNWSFMIKNVIALAAKYGEDNEENDVGVITASEAKQALHIHRGDIWDAVTECIENRQRKILELTVRGNFTQKQIADTLKNNEGNVELAYADLLRASSRRHKFILSPGLSEDSEYNPVDESAVDHNVSIKAGKLDVPADSKSDKKKSDFLTKLSAIRQAQSERRKAREEKEIIRETTTQDVPDTLETRVESPQNENVNLPRTEESSHQEPIAEEPVGDIEKELADAKLEFEMPTKDTEKKDNEDNLPEDYDTNWVESQGEWIEEYSDEQWEGEEEGDGQWVSLQKKYQSMEKEFEEEAKQMAALWEKEELEDDVFEEEQKEALVESSEAEKMKQEQDAKFQQWVKVNLEKSLSEPEENEPNDQPLKLNLSKEPSFSRSVEFDEGLMCKSPLQHYPTELDLSLKTEPDWVELEDAVDLDVIEKEEMEDKFKENQQDVLVLEDQTQIVDNSDEEWEKIDLEIDMLDEKAIERMTSVPILDSRQEYLPEVSVDKKDIPTQYFEKSNLGKVEDNAEDQISSVLKSGEESEINANKSPESAFPKPPVRRRSKLNTAAIEEVLKSREPSGEVSQLCADVPPALPLKRKDKSPENTLKDIYAVPDKHKVKAEEKTQTEISSSKGKEATSEPQPPLKPPRVNLSPSVDFEAETGEKRSLNIGFSKDASPVTSLSNESDSNCFADSESDPEIKIIRQKYMHRKAAKYENDEDDMFDETELTSKMEEPESPSALRKEVELQSKAFEFDPELPIPVGTRGSRVVEIDEVESPKAFREGTARPLQLFKVTKQSSTEMAPEPTFTEQNKDIDTMVSGIVKAYQEHVSEIPDLQKPTSAAFPSELNMRGYQMDFSIPEPQLIPDVVDPHYYNASPFEQQPNLKNIQGFANVPQAAPEVEEEILDTSLPSEPIPEEPLPIPYEDQPQNEEEEIAFTKVEGVFAAADYFFGRYNEVTVAKPKKRTTIVKGGKTPASAASKVMSASEIVVPPVSQPSVMEKSASPVMMPTPTTAPEAVATAQPQKAPRSPKVEGKTVSAVEPPPEPEYLPFAEDYFFGSYNEVVVPKKGKKKIPVKPIPKVPEKVKVDEAIPAVTSVSQAEMVSPETSQTITSSSTTSPVVSALQHAESTTSLYFDTSSLMEDTFYLAETQDQPVDNEMLSNNDKRVKSVHFEDPQPAVVPPPRKNRPKLMESNRSSISSYTSAADEFMYEQYGQSSQLSEVDKKKLHPYSEDFKLNQESDPSDFSCESFLQPSDHPESAISSEISVCTSKEPSNIINLPITGLFDKNTKHELSDEFLSQELSSSDKVQDFIGRQSTLSQGATIASDTISADRKFDEDLLEIHKTSENLQTLKFSEGDSLIFTNAISEGDTKSVETVSAEQRMAAESSEIQSSSKNAPSLDTSDVSKEVVITDSEIIEADLRISENASIVSYSEQHLKADLKLSEDGNSNFKMTSGSFPEYPTDITEEEISGGHTPVSEDILISDSYTVKLESSSMTSRFQDEEANAEIERDTYSVHMDEDFEDGLLLVEEAENLINEFCDIYPPGIFDIASSNEIQNLNTKNNKQESTYDSEHEWKLNEERYNTLNANFIENKLYKSKGGSDPHIADVKESLIIDIKSAECSEVSGISLEASTSDSAEISDIGDLVFASSEDLMTVSSQSNMLSVEDSIPEGESRTESNTVIQTTSESIPVKVIQPLSILCQEAASTSDFEPSCTKRMMSECPQGAEGEEGVLSELDYSKSELLDVSFDVSDESLVTSTRSSISTQIPVPSDVQIQDLMDELDYEVESKTPVQPAVEEGDETLDIPSNIDLDQINLEMDSAEVPLALSASSKTDPGTQFSTATEPDISIIIAQDDENLTLASGNNTEILLTRDLNKDDIVDNILTLEDNIEDSVTSLDKNISLTIDDDPVISLPEHKESNENVSKTKEDLSAGYGIISDVYNSASQNQADISVNKEEQVEIQHTIIATEIFHKTEESDSSEAVQDSSELSQNQVKDKHVDSCKNESPESNTDQVLMEDSEESCVSLMSHFYEEWFENVKTSGKSSILQQDVRSKYAAYYNYAESSNSGSASENEDFTQVDATAVSNLVSTQVELSIEESKAPIIEDDVKDILEQDKDQEVDACDSSIEIKTYDELPQQTTLMDKLDEDQYKDIAYENYIKNSGELSDVSSEELTIFESNRQIIESVGYDDRIFTTTKSCQTDDSFEEDQFYDSFDDPLMDPSLLYLPIDKKENIEPVKVEIGIQCHLITSEVIVPSDKTLTTLKTETKTYKSEEIQVGKGDVNIFEDPMVLNDIENGKVVVTDVSTLAKEDSSFEISEDSDSDLFLEPQSFHDELDAEGNISKSKSSFLCAEIDSGFSSGSDCGKRTYEHVASAQDFVAGSSDTGEISVTHGNKSEHKVEMTDREIKEETESTSKVIKVIKGKTAQELSEEESIDVTKVALLKTNEELYEKTEEISCTSTSHIITSKEDGRSSRIEESRKKIEDGRKKIEDSRKKIEDDRKKVENSKKKVEDSKKKIEDDRKKIEDSRKKIEESRKKIEDSRKKIEDSKKKIGTNVSDICDVLAEEDIFERAVTPIAIEKVPSIEDLTFIELQTDITEQIVHSETVVHSESCSTPTVEYFYGPLPASVASEIPPEGNDFFVEALDLLDACASEITKNHVENALASLAYDDHSSSKSDINLDSDELSESLSSFHEFDDDSLTESASEYFLPTDDDDDKADLKHQLEEKNALKVADLNVSSICETSHMSSTKHTDQQSDLKTISLKKSKEVKSNIQSSSLGVSNASKTSTEEVIDKKSDEATESLSVDPDSLNDNDRTCDASEFEDSLYLESTSEYSLPADTLSKHSEKLTKPLTIISNVTSIVSQAEFNNNLPKPYQVVEATKKVELLIQDNLESEVSVSLNKVQTEENVLQPHIPKLDESFYSESIPEYFPPEKSQDKTALEEIDSVVNSSQIICDDEDFATQTSRVASSDTSENFQSVAQSETSEINIPKSGQIKLDLSNNLNTSGLHIESCLSTSAVDESLYLESIPDYFAPEAISAKTEEIEISSDTQKVSEDLPCTVTDGLTADKKNYSCFTLETEITSKTDEEELKITSYKSDIPPVPSDIVRYLYYGDDITFEEDSSVQDDISFNSAHNVEPISESGVIHSDNSFQSLNSELKDLKQESEAVVKKELPVTHLASIDTSPELISQDFPVSVDEQSAEYQSIQTFSSDPECFESAYSEPESTDQWYELEATRSLLIHEAVFERIPKSESCTETNSLTKEDGELPCIPELILEQGTKDNFPVAKVDSDEVTDISTHFTMTEDDSDRFSDIESDSSLQDFEADVAFPLDTQSKNGESINGNAEKEAEHIVFSEDHRELSECRIKESSTHETVSQGEVFLDPNANEQVEISVQACVLEENLGSEELVEDTLPPVRDFNGNVTDSPISLPLLEMTEVMPLAVEKVSSEPKQQISTTQPLEVERIPSLDSKIISSSSFIQTSEDEYCDVSQTTESCYTSPIVESDYWLDANNESVLETEDSEFILPNEGTVGVLTSQNNTPIDSVVISSEEASREIISNVDIRNDVIEQYSENIEHFSSTSNIENTTERVICSVSQEVASDSDVVLLQDLSTNEVTENENSKQVLNIQESKELFVTDSFSIKDPSVEEIDPASTEDKRAIIKREVKSANEMLMCEVPGQAVIPKEESQKLYETKEIKAENFPRDADALPSVVSEVIETECMLNFGSKEGIRVPLEDKVCHEVPEVPAVQIEPDFSLERESTSQDFLSSDAVDKSSVLQDAKRIDLIHQEETFSFSKFGYLFKDGKLVDSSESFCETNSDSPLNVDLSVKHTEEFIVSNSSIISGVDKSETFLATDSELLEESEQSIITMGQISTVLYPKTDDKQHIKGKECSYLSIEPDDFDNLKKDYVSEIPPQEILITNIESFDESNSNVDSSRVFKTVPEKVTQVHSLQSDKTSPKLDQDVQEESELKECVNKDEITDASFRTLSEESDSWHEGDSAALDDLPNDNVDNNLSLKQDLTVPDKVDAVLEDKLIFSDEKQNVERGGTENIVSNAGLVSATTLESFDGNLQKEQSSKIESFSYSETESANFYSACDDLDNTSVITSDEDFTDVPSHFTLPEGSEAWSDIETDVSAAFDDCEELSFSMRREKTPTRDDGGYTFRDDDFYSFKGNLVDETTKDDRIENSVLETEVNSKITLLSKCSVSENKVEISESVIKMQESESRLPQFMSSHDDSLLKEGTNNEALAADGVSLKEFNQETNVCNIETSNDCLKDVASSYVLEENIKLDNFEKDVHEQVSISQDNIDKHINTSVASEIALEKDNSEEFFDFGNEGSEQSSYSMFKTISKDDVSENFSDIESEVYGDFEDSFSKADEQQHSETYDFVPFAEESGKSTVKRNKNSKKIVGKVDSTDKKKVVELGSSFNEMEKDLSKVEGTEFATEQITLTDGKRTLSLSIADIVEASELQQKTDETTETLLLEQFADIKSLNEPLALAETFSIFEPDTAKLKIHEDTGDVSWHLEMTEDSDYWLEAETEYSISEFEDEAVSLSLKDITDPFLMDVNNVSDHHLYATSSQHSDATAAGISTTFYTDTDYSEQISDTCADISLQGATTDNSDKWSDFEGDAAIDEALYGLAHTSETNKEDLTTAPSFSLQEDQGGLKLTEAKRTLESLSNLPVAGSTEKQELLKTSVIVEKVSSENASIQLSHTLEKSSDSVSESYTQPLSDPSEYNIAASRASDEDFTSITPLDGTVDESDKYSDISNDSSLEEIQHDSKSISKKSSMPPKVTSDISNEEFSVRKSKTVNESALKIENKLQVDVVSPDSMDISNIDKEHELVSEIKDNLVSEISKGECIENIKTLEEDVQASGSIISSLKDVVTENVVYEELTLDTIQEDVSEADTSGVVSTENAKIESEVDETGTYDRLNLSTSPAYENEDYENYEDNFEGDEYIEREEYDPNMEENEMEFGEEDYPDESVPYIENEDELVYPLQTVDWIGESFDLKEYGIDYGMSGSETDVHGFGVHDEYEDMHRAIDFNISNFDEAIDNFIDDPNLTTESFKTISNGTPTQSKMTDKEHESWSTADADSIDDDLSEHDNVISKIDELLAEDFAYDHTDYYRDEESAEVGVNEEVQCISPIEESFKIQDTEVADFKVTESAAQVRSAEENIKSSTEAVKNDKDKNISGISSKPIPSPDRIIDNSLVSKQSEECTFSKETTVGQLETVAVKEQTQVVQETESDFFKVKKSSPVVSDIISIVDSNSKISSEESESLTVKEPNQIEPKIISTSESKSKMSSDQLKSFTVKKPSVDVLEPTSASDSTKISEQSDSFTVKKQHETENESVVSSTSKISSEQSGSFTLKKPSKDALKTILDSTAISEQSESFTVKKQHETAIENESVVSSTSKISSEQSGSFTLKKPSKDAGETISARDSTTISEQSESFTVKKQHDTAIENESVVSSTSKISSEQSGSFTLQKPSKDALETTSASDLTKSSEESESFTLKKQHETATENVSAASSDFKASSEQSESFTLRKPSQEQSEVIPVVDTNYKVLTEKQDSLTVEKTSHSLSENVSISDSHPKSGQDAKKELLRSDLTSQSSKVEFEDSESTKSERLSKEDTTINLSLKVSSKKSVSHSETETAVSLPKTATTDTTPKIEQTLIKEETTKLDLKTETKITESPVNVSVTPVGKPIIKEEISETKSNIPSEQTEKQLTPKTFETVSSTEQTETTVRRRRVRKTSQSTEEEPADSKPDIPLKRRRDSTLRTARKTSVSSPDDPPSDSKSSSSDTDENKSKPDIPEKRKRKPALPKADIEPKAEKQTTEAPSLPPKTIKRDSSSDSISSSVFMSSSSESLSCYESASLKDSPKSKTVAEPEAPDVPARKAPVRQRRRESSEDTSSSSLNRSESSRRSYDLPPKESMDLCRKRTSIDERMVKLQAAGKCTTKETAFIAAKLIEMQFEEEDALLASRQCSSIYHAVKFLTQLCELCQCRFPINSMASMIHCAHRACKECLKAHFTNQIYDRSVFTLLCPICHKPDITDQNIQEYFNHLEIMFRSILDTNAYDLFQRKLRDEVLTKDPNFHWCSQCSSGFIASPRLKKLYCPDCSAITCASCHQTWELEHEGVQCERFQQWKDMHTPEPPPAGLVKFLTDRGVTCPSCDINYEQACAGCMMYKCSHCSFEFCGFCSRPCKRGKECGNKQCELRGIHAHHPYSCLFFLRDIDVSELQMLLEEESVKYLTIPPKDQIVKSRCQVREQKHTHGSITEDRCGRDIVPYCAGLCRTHYYEYLAELMRKNKINPLSLMTTQDLQFMLRKSRCPMPEKVKGESNEEFYDRLTETVSSTLS